MNLQEMNQKIAEKAALMGAIHWWLRVESGTSKMEQHAFWVSFSDGKTHGGALGASFEEAFDKAELDYLKALKIAEVVRTATAKLMEEMA